jgi:hypothetical protein
MMLSRGRAAQTPEYPAVPAITALAGRNRRTVTLRRS